MPSRPAVRSAFENLRPTIIREPSRSAVSPEAEARLLSVGLKDSEFYFDPNSEAGELPVPEGGLANQAVSLPAKPLLLKKKRQTLLLVSFRMPQSLKEKLERAAKRHELNQTDLINEAIELNLQRYL